MSKFVSMIHPSLYHEGLNIMGITVGGDDGIEVVDTDDGQKLNGSDEARERALNIAVGYAPIVHIQQTMVLPSNVARIREVAGDLDSLAVQSPAGLGADGEWIREMAETLRGVADNLDPSKEV